MRVGTEVINFGQVTQVNVNNLPNEVDFELKLDVIAVSKSGLVQSIFS